MELTLDERLDEKLDERLGHLPTKDDFYSKTDEVVGELKAIHEEHLSDHADRLDKLESGQETAMNIGSTIGFIQITLFPIFLYLLPVKRLYSSFSFLLSGGVTDLQVEVLYSSTQYYFVVGLATTLCPYPDIVAFDSRNI